MLLQSGQVNIQYQSESTIILLGVDAEAIEAAGPFETAGSLPFGRLALS
jgi:hypothetical protein